MPSLGEVARSLIVLWGVVGVVVLAVVVDPSAPQRQSDVAAATASNCEVSVAPDGGRILATPSGNVHIEQAPKIGMHELMPLLFGSVTTERFEDRLGRIERSDRLRCLRLGQDDRPVLVSGDLTPDVDVRAVEVDAGP